MRSAVVWALVVCSLGPVHGAAAQSEAGTSGGASEGSAAAAPTRSQAALDEAADRYERLGADAASEAVLGHLLRNPDDRLTAVRYSHWLRSLRNFDAAIAFLRRVRDVPELTPARQPEAAHELGALLARRREYDETVRTLESVTDTSAGTYDMTRMNLAMAYQAQGRFAEARAIYAEIDGASMRLFATANDCEAVLGLDGPEAAGACLRAGVERFGEHPALRHAQALVAYVAGDFDAARTHVDALFEVGNPGGRVDALRALLAQRSSAEAGVQAAEDIAQVTLTGEHRAIRALALWRAERHDEAAAAYGEAVDANPVFGSPDQVARILHWRPDDVSALQAIAAARSEAAESATVSQPTPSSPNGDDERTGCCSSIGSRAARPGPLSGLGLALLLLRRRSRAHKLRA